MSLYSTPIDDLRNGINQIDKELAILFVKRMDYAKEIGLYKQSMSMPVEDTDREFDILRRVKAQVGSPYDEYIHLFFNGIFQATKAYQNSK